MGEAAAAQQRCLRAVASDQEMAAGLLPLLPLLLLLLLLLLPLQQHPVV